MGLESPLGAWLGEPSDVSPPDDDRPAAADSGVRPGMDLRAIGLLPTLCSRSPSVASPWICHDVSVFIEQVTAPREEFELWDARLGMVTQPPPALALSVAWESDGVVTCINVWDSPQAIADFFLERVQPYVEAEGPPANKPQRLGHAVRAYIRPAG